MSHRASAEDVQFIGDLEAYRLAAGEFSHRSHLRMAYAYLCQRNPDNACGHIRQVLCGFLTHHGIEPETKYHETLTQAWLRIVNYFMLRTPVSESAEQFIEANPQLMDSQLIEHHYSGRVLKSTAARKSFVEPDLHPIPSHGPAA